MIVYIELNLSLFYLFKAIPDFNYLFLKCVYDQIEFISIIICPSLVFISVSRDTHDNARK